MFDFTQQVVVVTGASGNLGKAVVSAFAAAGATIVAPDRREGRLQSLFPALADGGRHLLAGPIDIGDPAAMRDLVAQAMSRFGRVDVLVNTVGGYDAGKLPHETPLESWDAMLALNARAVHVACQQVVPPMLARGHGRIVNTAARSALAAGAREVAYAVSKSAVARLTESYAAAYVGDGITVNAVMPGTIDTPQNREAMPDADHARWVAPEAIAQVIMFLASDAAGVVNGALVPCFGKT